MAMPFMRFKKDDGSNYPDWNNDILINLASIHARIGWQNMRISEFQDTGNYYVITGTDFKNGKVNFDTCKFVSKERYDQDEHIQVNNESVLVTKDGTLGKTAYIQELEKPATLNAGVYNIRSLNTQKIINKYLFYYLSSPLLKEFAFKKSTNGPIRHLNQNILINFNVNFPCPEEQQKIANFLSDIDAQIEHYQQSLDNLEAQKKTLLHQVFTQEIRFTKEDSGNYPDWEEDIIDSIGNCIAGATPSTKNNNFWDNGTIPWLSSGEVNKGQIYDTDRKITQSGYDNCSTKMVKANSVIIAMAGQGKTRGTVGITRIPLCTNQSLCSIETNEKVLSDYLYQYLKTRYIDLRNLSSGNDARGGLNLVIIKNFKIAYPSSLEEQHKIADFFTDFDERIEMERQRLQTMQELKKGLLQQMFC